MYCEAENRLVSEEVANAQQEQVRFAQVVEEAEQMQSDVEPRAARLMAEFEAAQQSALVGGDTDAAQQAVRHFEGYMRLQYAPTIHMYKTWDPTDPQVEQALRQIDETIDQAVGSVAESLGVEYRPTRDRLE
jgi:hypothetical protein